MTDCLSFWERDKGNEMKPSWLGLCICAYRVVLLEKKHEQIGPRRTRSSVPRAQWSWRISTAQWMNYFLSMNEWKITKPPFWSICIRCKIHCAHEWSYLISEWVRWWWWWRGGTEKKKELTKKGKKFESHQNAKKRKKKRKKEHHPNVYTFWLLSCHHPTYILRLSEKSVLSLDEQSKRLRSIFLCLPSWLFTTIRRRQDTRRLSSLPPLCTLHSTYQLAAAAVRHWDAVGAQAKDVNSGIVGIEWLTSCV
jgi:hypothetical protein